MLDLDIAIRLILLIVTVTAFIFAFYQWHSKKAMDLRTKSLDFSLTKNQFYLENRKKIDGWFKGHPAMVEYSDEYDTRRIEALALCYDNITHLFDDKKYMDSRQDLQNKNPIFEYNNNDFKSNEESARYLLAHWEIMAIAIVNECIDERVCFEMVGTTLISTIRRLRPYIDDLRQGASDFRRYDYLLILEDSWRRHMEDAKRRHAPTVWAQARKWWSDRMWSLRLSKFFWGSRLVLLDEDKSRYREYLNSGRSIGVIRRKLFSIKDEI